MLSTRVKPQIAGAVIVGLPRESTRLVLRRREDHENTSAAIRCVLAAETYKLTGRLPVWASAT